jgi:hypothetical protein
MEKMDTKGIDWSKILDGIAWSYDSEDNTIWGHDTCMNTEDINKQITERLKEKGLVTISESGLKKIIADTFKAIQRLEKEGVPRLSLMDDFKEK